MRVVLQRVNNASVRINNKDKAKIDAGLLVFLGIETTDQPEDVSWLCKKIAQLRIFDDKNGVMNRSLLETGGSVLVISQFTLHAKTKKGNRPSYIHAARPETALPLYHEFIDTLSALIGKQVLSGTFGAYMQVSLENDGPVTILIDTKNKE